MPPPNLRWPPAPSTVPPAVAGTVPAEYRKIAASAAAVPEWTWTIPDDAGGLHFLVALSEVHASEQEARETAMKNARLEYARYTGVEVTEVDEVLRSLYGASSEVLDPTVAGHNLSRQSTAAKVSRIKAKQWYCETYQVIRAGNPQGVAYKCWVLVTVPTDEIARVQQWRRSRQVSLLQARQQLQAQADRELQAVLEEHRQQLGRIDEELAEGELVSALVAIREENERLGRAEQQFKDRGQPFAGRAPQLAEARKTTLDRVEQGRSSLVIDVGHCGNVCVLQTTRGYVLPVWVWSRWRR